MHNFDAYSDHAPNLIHKDDIQPSPGFFANNWRVLLLSAAITPVPFYPAFGVLALIASVSATPIVFTALTAASIGVTFLSAFAASKLMAVIGTWLFFSTPSPTPPPQPSSDFKDGQRSSLKGPLDEIKQDELIQREDSKLEDSFSIQAIHPVDEDIIPSHEELLERNSEKLPVTLSSKKQPGDTIELVKSLSEKSVGSNTSGVSIPESSGDDKHTGRLRSSFFNRRKSKSPTEEQLSSQLTKPGSPAKDTVIGIYNAVKSKVSHVPNMKFLSTNEQQSNLEFLNSNESTSSDDEKQDDKKVSGFK